MLAELKVSQFAIIENLHIHFKNGLNILSGETGAGKSVLLKSLGLLMGAKSSSEMIRTGFQQAIIEGSFDISDRKDIQLKLANSGIETDDQILIVRRVIGLGDKSKVYLNGSLANLSQLRDLVSPMIEVTGHAAPLIEMTGQHENKNLTSKSYHLDILDQYVGSWDLRSEYENKFLKRNELLSSIQSQEEKSRTGAQRLDFLIYQRDEISKLDLHPGEEQDLEINIRRLKNTSKVSHFIEQAESVLISDDDSATQRLQTIIKMAHELSHIDPQISQQIEPLESAKNLVEECIFDLRKYLKTTDDESSDLETMEAKLSDFRKLQKKYGSNLSDIMHSLVKIEQEIYELQNSEAILEKMRAEVASLNKELRSLGQKIHTKRANGSKTLTESVNKELLDLNMKGVTFFVEVNETPDLGPHGISDVEFMSQSSAKDSKRSLGKAASGGELSRILLSLKRVVGTSGFPRTYLFDEVDTGVSGETAEKVGKKLASIAKGQQVICVTHLPQVAACGEHHFFIQKNPKDGGVSMEVSELKEKQRVQEIARLISGEKITKTSLAHAEQLLGL